MSQAPETKPASPAIVRQPVAMGPRGIDFATYDDLARFSSAIIASGLAPKGIDKPETAFVIIQMGMELGLPAMASLQNIASINGRPAVWGDAQLGICRATGQLEQFDEWYEHAGQVLDQNPTKYDDTTTAFCCVKRAGKKARTESFSVADAKRAGLWGKSGPWSQYPQRMLRFRARSFALRDEFGDALRGLLTVEEVRDMSRDERDVTPKARTKVLPPPHMRGNLPPPDPEPDPGDLPVSEEWDGDRGEGES